MHEPLARAGESSLTRAREAPVRLRAVPAPTRGRPRTPRLGARERRPPRVGPRARFALPVSLLGICALLGGCGAGAHGTSTRARVSTATPRTARDPLRLSTVVAGHLPQAVSGEALIVRDGTVLVLGGLNRLDESTSSIVGYAPDSGRVRAAGALAQAKHDLAAASLQGRELVLGGGSASELDSVEELTGGLSGVRVGTLPSPRSDLSAAATGGYVYVLGGFDGSAPPLRQVLRTRDGRRFEVAGTLPVGVRYAALAAAGSMLYAFGGELADGGDSRAIQAFDTATGHARLAGNLPEPVSHAAAVSLGGRIYILGGRSGATALRGIASYDPVGPRLRAAGELPFAVSNAAAASSGGVAYLVGGIGAGERTLDTVVAVRPAR